VEFPVAQAHQLLPITNLTTQKALKFFLLPLRVTVAMAAVGVAPPQPQAGAGAEPITEERPEPVEMAGAEQEQLTTQLPEPEQHLLVQAGAVVDIHLQEPTAEMAEAVLSFFVI
jgi:hypothetical protein